MPRLSLRGPSLYFFASVSQTVIGSLCSLVAIPLFIRTYGTTLFGLYSLVAAIVGYLTMFGFGIDVATSITMNKEGSREHRHSIFRTGERLCFGLCALLALGLALLWGFYPSAILRALGAEESPALATPVTIMLFTGVLAVWFNIYAAGLRGEHKPHIENLIQIGIAVSLVTISFFSFTFSISFYYYSIMFFAVNALLFVARLFAFSITAIQSRAGAFSPQAARDLMFLGLSCSISTIATMLTANADLFIISRVMTLADVGAYAAFLKVVTLATTFIYTINAAFVPSLGIALGSSDKHAATRTYVTMRFLSLLIGLTFASGLAAFGRPVILAWTGFDLPRDLMAAAALHVVLFTAINANMIFYNADGRVSKTAMVLVVEAIAKVTISVSLLPWLGLTGALLGTLLANFFCSFLVLRFTNRDLSGAGAGFPDWSLALAFPAALFALYARLDGLAATVAWFCGLILISGGAMIGIARLIHRRHGLTPSVLMRTLVSHEGRRQ